MKKRTKFKQQFKFNVSQNSINFKSFTSQFSYLGSMDSVISKNLFKVKNDEKNWDEQNFIGGEESIGGTIHRWSRRD